MASFYDKIDSALDFCENFDDFADKFVFNNVTYRGFFDDTKMVNQLAEGGDIEELDGTLVVRKASFSNVVVPIDSIIRKTLSINNRTFRVATVNDDRVSFKFTLIDVNR